MIKENMKLSKTLSDNGINELILTSLGNSIASGYSWMSTTKPLLYRDESLEQILLEKGITLKRYHYARYANNNDEHIYSYLTRNLSLREMYHLNRVDIAQNRVIGLSEQDIDTYYPENLVENRGLKDIILKNNPGIANIVIYNGATGSFLDNVTRKGRHKFTTGIKRDCTSIEATLKNIQVNNRFMGTNTQVYLCGAPRILNTKITDIFINNRLQKIALNYANVTYVPPISRKILYHHPEYGTCPDTHYNEEEYQEFLSKIISSISKNYLKTMAKIDIDRKMFNISSEIEEGKLVNNIDIENVLTKWLTILSANNININKFLKELRLYLIERQPYDFYYIGNETINRLTYKLKK